MAIYLDSWAKASNKEGPTRGRPPDRPIAHHSLALLTFCGGKQFLEFLLDRLHLLQCEVEVVNHRQVERLPVLHYPEREMKNPVGEVDVLIPPDFLLIAFSWPCTERKVSSRG